MKKLIFLLLSFFSLIVNASDFVVNGIAYNALSLTDLTCEVTSNSSPYSGDIEIPEKVTYQNRTFTVIGIGDNAFDQCGELTSLLLPNTLTYIGRYAFSCCEKITKLSVPGSVMTIGWEAFFGCTNMKNLRLDDGDSTLETECNPGTGQHGVFYYCNIDTLYLGRNLLDRGETYFSNGSYSKYRNTLSEVTIGNCVTKISKKTFPNPKFKRLVIPSSVVKIENDAIFAPDMEELVFEDGDTPIQLGLMTSTTASMYPEGEWGIFGISGIKTLYIGRNLLLPTEGSKGSTRYRYKYGFYDNYDLKNVTIGENVTELPAYLFYDCNSLERIVLPAKLAVLNTAFEGCTNLMDIVCHSLTPPSIEPSSFTNNQFINATVKVEDDAYDKYKANEVWGQFWGLTKATTDIQSLQSNDRNIKYQINNGCFSISGLENDEEVILCDTSGKIIGNKRAFLGEVIFNIGISNKIIIVKIGNKSIKLAK